MESAHTKLGLTTFALLQKEKISPCMLKPLLFLFVVFVLIGRKSNPVQYNRHTSHFRTYISLPCSQTPHSKPTYLFLASSSIMLFSRITASALSSVSLLEPPGNTFSAFQMQLKGHVLHEAFPDTLPAFLGRSDHSSHPVCPQMFTMASLPYHHLQVHLHLLGSGVA